LGVVITAFRVYFKNLTL